MNRRHRWLVCAFAVSFVLAACHDAQAQYRGTRSLRRPRRSSITDQPSISPILSLTNPGADPGANYAAFTGPLLYQQDMGARNAQSIRRLQLDTGEAGLFGDTRTTGHSATFMNYSHYYGGTGQTSMGSSSGFTRRSGSTGRSGGGMMGGMGGGMMGGMGMF